MTMPNTRNPISACLLIGLVAAMAGAAKAQSTPGTVNYPNSLDDKTSLFEVRNTCSSTLAATMGAADTVLTLNDASQFPPSGAISVDNEILFFTGKGTGNTLIGLLRGQDGTAAAAHAPGAPVDMRIIARNLSALRDAIIAIETRLGTGTQAGTFATIGNPNTWGAAVQTFDSGPNFVLQDPADNTKQVTFNLSGISTGQMRTITSPDGNSVTVEPVGVQSHEYLTGLGTNGVFSQAQPSVQDLAEGFSGGGQVARVNSPALVSPSLGAATAASINNLAITPPLALATLDIASGKTLTVNNSIAMAGVDNTTLTFQGSDTYVGRATTDTLTNKTFDTGGAGNVFKINGAQVSGTFGNTGVIATANGSFTSNDCVKFDANGNIVDAGGACTTSAGGAVSWSNITNPVASESIVNGTFPTTLTWGDLHTGPALAITMGALSTSPAVKQFAITDTTGNTNTGPLVNINTVGTSTALPLEVTAQGTANGIKVDTSGILRAAGSGGVDAAALASGTTIPLGNLSGLTSSQLSASAGITNGQLANSSIGINNGGGLVAPGAVSLGSGGTISLDLTHANSWTGAQTFASILLAAISDTNGNRAIGINPTASAVDYLTVTNAASGSPGIVGLSAGGTDSNISLAIKPVGDSGNVMIEDDRGDVGLQFGYFAGFATWTAGNTGANNFGTLAGDTTDPIVSIYNDAPVEIFRFAASGVENLASGGAVNFGSVSAPTAGLAEASAGNLEVTNGGSTVYTMLGSNGVDITSTPLITEIANASTTGTTVNKLAKLTGAPSTAVIAATTDTLGIVGVVSGQAGTAGNAQVAIKGQVNCVFDGGTTAGDYVQISSSVGGDCHDSGSSYPTLGQVIGRVLTTNSSGGPYAVQVFGPGIAGNTVGPITQNGMVYGGSGSLAFSAAATDGQLLMGSSVGAPALATLTGTANEISVTNGHNSITLATPQAIGTGSSPTFAAPTFSTSATTPVVYGGTATGSTLILNGTSSGSPNDANVYIANSASGAALAGLLAVGAQPYNQVSAVGGGDQIVATADTEFNAITAQNYSASNFGFFYGRRGRGSAASPSAAQAGDIITRFSGRAINSSGSGYSSVDLGMMQIVAEENQTGAAQGGRIGFWTTAKGTTTTNEVLRIESNGGIQINTAAATPVVGDMFASENSVTIYCHGNKLVFAYDAAGTMHFITIPITGTAGTVTVTDTTTAP